MEWSVLAGGQRGDVTGRVLLLLSSLKKGENYSWCQWWRNDPVGKEIMGGRVRELCPDLVHKAGTGLDSEWGQFIERAEWNRVCVCVCTHMYVFAHTCMHTYIHTHVVRDRLAEFPSDGFFFPVVS